MRKWDNLPDLLTLKELQEFLQIGRNTALEYCHNPSFPSIKIGRKWRIPKEQLKEWIAKQVEEASSVTFVNEKDRLRVVGRL